MWRFVRAAWRPSVAVLPALARFTVFRRTAFRAILRIARAHRRAFDFLSRAERARSDRSVVERHGVVPKFLVGLVALAREEDDVARLRQCDRVEDRLPAIRHTVRPQ